ncbi:tRNA adenosine(34) deaminase TadA [Nesterenkonia sp. HG001]|uniref:tRNA adenosine(34) deaminase TadA n=1 Tax=Nesterenkonia sp. HG001 TaxID=2983207 RepID=UPI002AC745BA|nr:tRNA adenosine(34) deaminase TadA [Nesterenkonia sp. HG001]MDZ5076657.1 tRNA adenosine(34) deaminase TadA [Nesterenkonia sp. HG001]
MPPAPHHDPRRGPPSVPSRDPRDAAVQAELVGRCLALAEQAAAAGDVPVGAVVVSPEGEIIGEGHNTREADGDPTGHAEIIALREAARRRGTWRLEDCTLAVTLEPCPMCAGAIVLSRIRRVIFGAWDEKAGGAGSVFDILREPRLNHWVEVHPEVRAEECAAQLSRFFAQRLRSNPGAE